MKSCLRIIASAFLVLTFLIMGIEFLTETIKKEREGDINNKYISCAKTLIQNNLKDPSSVIYNDAYVYEKDDYGRAIVYLDYSARNGFGGMGRERKYVFINGLNDDGTFTYHTWYYCCDAGGGKESNLEGTSRAHRR